jgi:hypothetical protein
VLLSFASAAWAGGVGSAFTVQGVFSDNGVPLNNEVDLIVGLFDAAVDGNAVAPEVRFDAVTAVEGLITVTVDFGADAFVGEARFLELQIRNPHDPNDVAPFVLLDTRIPITPTPEAVHAQNADNAQSADSVVAPLNLTLDDADTPTLVVENVATDGVALNVRGDLTVGAAGEVQVDFETGNISSNGDLLAQGTVTASGLASSGDASIGGDASVGGTLDMTSGPITNIGANGSFFNVGGGLFLKDRLDVLNNQYLLSSTNFMASAANAATINTGSTVSITTAAGTSLFMSFLGTQVSGNPFRVGINSQFTVDDQTGDTAIDGVLQVDGDTRLAADLHLTGAFHDSNDSSGALGQVLTSRSVGTEWRTLGEFEGDVDVQGDFVVGPPGGRLFTVERGLEQVSVSANLEVNNGQGDPVFTVERGVEQVTAHRPFRVRLALRDFGDSPGTTGQVLSSTGDGVVWINLGDFPSGLRVPDANNPVFQVASTGDTSIDAPLSVRVTVGGNPGPGESKAVSSVIDTGIAVEGIVTESGFGVSAVGQGANGAGVSANAFGGATGVSVGAFGGGVGLDVLSQSRIGDMRGNSAAPEGALNVHNDGTGHTFVVSGGDGMHVEKAYYDSANSPGADGQILGSTTTGTQWRNLVEEDLDLKNFAITNIGTNGSFFAPTGGLIVRPEFLVSGAEGQTGIFQADNTNVSAFRDFDVRTTDNSNIVFSVDNEQGNTTAEGYVEPKGGVLDEAGSLGAAGQLLSSTGSGVLWQDCDCGGGGGDTCLTCTGTDAHFDGDIDANGSVTCRDFYELLDQNDEVVYRCDSTSCTYENDVIIRDSCSFQDGAVSCGDSIVRFEWDLGNEFVEFDQGGISSNVPVFADATFNFVRNLVTDRVQVSAEETFSPVFDAVATANSSPLVRFVNFLGSDLALSVIGNTQTDGDLDVTGTLSKGGGSFKIDHPLDPENKYLYHSFVESPDMMNIYNGNATTDGSGYATIFLPDWFDTLNRDFRYQLTVIDDADGDSFVMAKVVKRIELSQFTIRTSEPFTDVSWQVTGIRQDAWANANRIPVEAFKPIGEQGKYRHPAEHGMPEELGVGYEAKLKAIEAQGIADSKLADYRAGGSGK